MKFGGANRYCAQQVERYIAEQAAHVELWRPAPPEYPAAVADAPARRGPKPQRVRLLEPGQIRRAAV